jgi:hypothetical protein
MSRGNLDVGGAGDNAYASFVNDVVAAAAREDEVEGQLGATNQSSNRHRRRVVETLSDHYDERTLKALSKMVPDLVREVLGRRGTAGTGGGSNPSLGRKSRAARRQIELDVGIAEGGAVADTRLHAVGTTTGESKGSDGDETLDGIAAGNQEFVQHQRKEKERVDAEAAVQEKPDTQYSNPIMQQQRQQARQGAEEAETAEEERGIL